MNRSWPDLCFKKREDSELQPKADDGIALLSAIVFGFLFLAWLLAFISLNASLGVVRTTKDLRFNPYQRGGSILIARAFASVLSGNPQAWSHCSSSGPIYTCVLGGSSQGSFASEFPDLDSWTCGNGSLSLQASGGSSCLKDLTIRLNTTPAEITARTVTGQPGRYLHQQATLQFKSGSYPMTAMPAMSIWPASPGLPCSDRQRSVQGTPGTVVNGSIQLYCGAPPFICNTLTCPENLYVDDRIQLTSGHVLDNETAPPNWVWPSLGNITSLVISNGTQGNAAFTQITATLSSQQCSSTPPTAAICQTVSINTLPSSLRALYIPSTPGADDKISVNTNQNLTILSGLALLITCRPLDFSQRVRLGTNASNRLSGSLIIVAAQVSGNQLQGCPIPPTYRFSNLDGAVSVIAPGVTLTIDRNIQSLYGTLLAQEIDLNGSDFFSDALAIGSVSDTMNALSSLFGTLLKRGNQPLRLSEWLITP